MTTSTFTTADEKLIPFDRQKLLYTPFDYTLIDSKNPIDDTTLLSFKAGGCPEDDNPEKVKEVAAFMGKTGSPATFSFLLGDNNKKHGVTDPNDEAFKTYFHSIHKEIFFTLLGNHDIPGLNLDAALAQIEHTFIDPKTGNWDQEKLKIYQGKELDLAKLRNHPNKWNMPGRYGVYRYSKLADLLIIDSTSFVKDFIKYFLLKTDKDPNNQAAWLFRAVKESTAKNKLLFSHHPLHAIDKRNILSDHTDYLSAADVEELRKIGIAGTNYNEMLEQIMFIAGNADKGIPAGPGPSLNEVYTAHHHAQSYLSKKKIIAGQESTLRQWITGGLGGPSQKRYRYDDHDAIKFSTSEYGYVQTTLTCDKSLTTVHFLNQPSLALCHDVFIKDPRKKKVAQLEKLILSACEEFQDYLGENPIYLHQPKYVVKGRVYDDWTPNFIHYSDQLKNYFNQEKPVGFKSAIEYLANVLKECTNDPKGIFDRLTIKVPYTSYEISATRVLNVPPSYFPKLYDYQKKWKDIFNQKLVASYNMTYEQFIENYSLLFSEKLSSRESKHFGLKVDTHCHDPNVDKLPLSKSRSDSELSQVKVPATLKNALKPLELDTKKNKPSSVPEVKNSSVARKVGGLLSQLLAKSSPFGKEKNKPATESVANKMSPQNPSKNSREIMTSPTLTQEDKLSPRNLDASFSSETSVLFSPKSPVTARIGLFNKRQISSSIPIAPVKQHNSLLDPDEGIILGSDSSNGSPQIHAKFYRTPPCVLESYVDRPVKKEFASPIRG